MIINTPNPLAVLKRESDSIRAVVTTIDGNIADLNNKITELATQKHSLNLVVTAIDNEMDRLRSIGVEEQLDLPLDEEVE